MTYASCNDKVQHSVKKMELLMFKTVTLVCSAFVVFFVTSLPVDAATSMEKCRRQYANRFYFENICLKAAYEGNVQAIQIVLPLKSEKEKVDMWIRKGRLLGDVTCSEGWVSERMLGMGREFNESPVSCGVDDDVECFERAGLEKREEYRYI